MSARKEITLSMAQQYRGSSRSDKTKILDELIKSTGFNRKYAIHLLCHWGKATYIQTDKELLKLVAGKWPKKPKQVKKPLYGPEIDVSLEKLWVLFDAMCGKRLASAIKDNLDWLKLDSRLKIPADHWDHLAKISPASMDRHLKKLREQNKLKGLSHTKPTSALKNLIPIRTGADWHDVEPGHFQMDTVGHDGGISSGQFCFTLNAIDVFSGWTEPRAMRNKAKKWAVEAFSDIHKELPFEMKSVHVDNGGEFINISMADACIKLHVDMTRSRPNRKNDNCYVECRNDDVVRHFVGYFRFSTEEAFLALDRVWRAASPLINYFYPSMRLLEKKRVGAKVVKKHDTPKTPYQRLLDRPDMPESVKIKLKNKKATLDLINLKLNLDKAVDDLLKLAETPPKSNILSVERKLSGLDSTNEATASSG